MNDSTQEISPLRQRMLEDMRLRKLAPHTQASYVRAVRKLAGYLRRPPDTATGSANHAYPSMRLIQKIRVVIFLIVPSVPAHAAYSNDQ
jgi:hypothetical protein